MVHSYGPRWTGSLKSGGRGQAFPQAGQLGLGPCVEIVSQLAKSIEALRRVKSVGGETIEIPLAPDMIEHLRMLGYVEE